MLEAGPAASCSQCSLVDNIPFEILLKNCVPTVNSIKFAIQCSQVTLHTFVAIVELVLDEKSSFSTENQESLRYYIADMLLDLEDDTMTVVTPTPTRMSVLSADAATLVESILSLESSTRYLHRPHEFVRRIMLCPNNLLPPCFETLHTNPAVTEMVNAWYKVNKSGRKELLIRRTTHRPTQTDGVRIPLALGTTSNSTNDTIEDDSTLLLRIDIYWYTANVSCQYQLYNCKLAMLVSMLARFRTTSARMSYYLCSHVVLSRLVATGGFHVRNEYSSTPAKIPA